MGTYTENCCISTANQFWMPVYHLMTWFIWFENHHYRCSSVKTGWPKLVFPDIITFQISGPLRADTLHDAMNCFLVWSRYFIFWSVGQIPRPHVWRSIKTWSEFFSFFSVIPARYPWRKQKSGGGVGKKNAPPKWAFCFLKPQNRPCKNHWVMCPPIKLNK